MTTPPPPPGNGGNEPFDPANPYPSSGDGSPSTPDQGPSYTEGTESASGPGFGESSQPGFGESGQSGPTFGDSAPPVGPPSYGGAPPPVGPPPGGGQGGESKNAKTLSFVSLGTGIVGVVLCCCWALPLFPAIALLTGFLVKRDANAGPDAQKFARIGVILGAIGLVIAVVYWILVATGVIDLNTTYNVNN